MATKISAMTAASALTGAEELGGVQSSASRKVTAAQIKTLAQIGTTTNDSAAAGSIGEIIPSTVLVGAAVALTTATDKTVTSLSLTAGDWDVWGNVGFSLNAATTMTAIAAAINTTTDALPTAPGAGAFAQIQAVLTTGATQFLAAGAMRISIASTTSVYLIARASFAVNTCAAYGYIAARRVR